MPEKSGYIELRIPVEEARELGKAIRRIDIRKMTKDELAKLLRLGKILRTKEQELKF